MESNIGSEIFSARASAGSRTYFFDVKESRDGTRYIVVSESGRSQAGVHEHHRLMVFEEHIEAFQRAMTQAVANLQKLREPPKAYSVDEIRKDHAMAYEKWTPEDDRRLWALHRSGYSITELSAEFNRKCGAIESRLRKLAMQSLDTGHQTPTGASKPMDVDLHQTASLDSSREPRGHSAQPDAQPDRKQAGELDIPF